MNFVKEHLIGILIGFVVYELYVRGMTQQRPQGG
jgi:uncharacterized short protein YbdD (DUF466 family)